MAIPIKEIQERKDQRWWNQADRSRKEPHPPQAALKEL